MAAITSKLGASLTGLSNLSGKGKLLAVGIINTQVPKANINSKTSGNLEPRMKPWNYKMLGFNYFFHLMDGTTKRFNDNSKMIVVEGPPALEKSKFAQELADELDMLYVPCTTMEQYYINPYGYDLRELDHKFHYIRNVSYDEKKFAQNPTGQDGGLDRMQDILQIMRYMSYSEGLCHIFNTGQGIVTEKSPYMDYVFTEAAYRQGWIDKTSRTFFYRKREQALMEILRPNLIIYLDAPLDVVQSKIRARGQTTHPWEKNSPVYENRDYMQHCYYDLMKKEYMREAATSSQVLMYDWSDGGDTEVVVEDIERLNMDYWDKYDKQQKDWRMHTEDNYARKRLQLTQQWRMKNLFKTDYCSASRIMLSNAERQEFNQMANRVPGSRYLKGLNEDMGDSNLWMSPSLGAYGRTQPDGWFPVDPTPLVGNHEHAEYLRQREIKKANGEARWWQF